MFHWLYFAFWRWVARRSHLCDYCGGDGKMDDGTERTCPSCLGSGIDHFKGQQK